MTDWTDQVADAIDGAVNTVRDKTVVPAQRVVRTVVAGLAAVSLLVVAALLAAVGVFRGLAVLFTEYLPGDVWTAHLVLGGILTGGGLFCWSRS